MAARRRGAPDADAAAGFPQWRHPRTRAWLCNYRAWDGATARTAVIVLPSGWGPEHHPRPLPLVISPHGRNNFAWNNANAYWQDLPADGPFALVCPDGLARAHDRASDPFDQPPLDPTLFTYGNPGHIDDLARMPRVVTEVLPWLDIDLERVYVLGSSMGGQETLLLAARYPKALSGGTGRLAGAAAFDSACDLVTQCGYLTRRPATSTGNPPEIASRMMEEIGTRPKSTPGWNKTALFHNDRTQKQMTIGQLLAKLPAGQPAWDERSPLTYAAVLAALPFPLEALLEQQGHRRRQPGRRPDRQALRPDQGSQPARRRRSHSRPVAPLGRVRPQRPAGPGAPQPRADRLDPAGRPGRVEPRRPTELLDLERPVGYESAMPPPSVRPLRMLLFAGALALVIAAAASGGLTRQACTPGVKNVGGVTVRTFCGPAKATVKFGSKTLHYSGGSCTKTSKYVAVNIGTVVLGQTTKAKPDYFGLDVGQVPGSTAKPAPKDGTYTNVVLALVYGGKAYFVSTTGTKVTLSDNRSKGTISGTAGFGATGKVTGSFSC